MAAKKKAQKVAPETINEVVEFLDAEDALKAFKEEHAAVFEVLEQLTERYNSALEQAEKVCRAQQVSCGPFDLYQFSTRYDAEALFNAVGRDAFLAMGGVVSTKSVYEVDRGRLEAAIAQNKLPEDVVAAVRKETPTYHKPERLVVP